MIRKLVRQMLTAQIFSALTVSLCLLVDSIMIGRFLGEEAIAAYGLANPILLVIGAVGSLLTAGVQVACSKSLGRGLQKETDAGYSSAVVLTLAISLAITLAVLLFRTPLAEIMGARKQPELLNPTRDYIAGFVLGAPGSMGALMLVPFLQMAGESTLLIVAVLTMTIVDIALDLLNVLVFHGGMFGMGLASSISYYAALLIGCFYFLSKKCAYHFSLSLVSGKKMAELFRGGIPSVFGMASTVFMILLMNRILLNTGGKAAVAAFSVITTISNASNCTTTGIGGVALTLAGIFYNEEDESGLKQLIRLLCRHSVILGVGMGLLLLVLAPAFVSLFIPEPGAAQKMAVLGLRITAGGLIPCCINNALKNTYQATGRVRLTEIISVLEGLVFPVLAAWVLSRFMGTNGAWFYFLLGEALLLIVLCVYIRRKTGQLPWKNGACLLLKQEFSAEEGHLLERELHSITEVVDAARAAEDFCLTHGGDSRFSSHIALCIEEMAGNVIQHGFEADGRNHLSIRVLHKSDHWVLRLRDDCRVFDPVHYVPAEGQDALGIRLVLAMADEVNYTSSLNLNNLTLTLKQTASDAGQPARS